MAAVAERGGAREGKGTRRREGLRSLAERCAAGERAALARAISVVEDRRPGFRELLARVARTSGRGRRAHRTGVTGPPGVGKSTLAAALAGRWRRDGEEVAILAVDPTSPFSGGALLGDRVRMASLRLDRGTFIRSMATRGAGGGLAEAVHDVVDLVQGSGFDRILLETVGVGQAELDVAAVADTVVATFAPESGDEVQAMKAGLAEVADVFVVNKGDLAGADELARQLREAIGMSGRTAAEEGAAPGWVPPVHTAAAAAGAGIEAIARAVEDHRRASERPGTLAARRVARARARVDAGVRAALDAHLSRTAGEDGFAEAARRVADGRDTVYEAVERLLRAGGVPTGGENP